MFRKHRITRFGWDGQLVLQAWVFASIGSLHLLGTPARAETIRESSHSFKVEGKTITMSCFTPDRDGSHPAVLLLHSSEGMKEAKDAMIYRSIAHSLVKHGYIALLVPYFERTGTKRIEPKDINEKLFKAWMETVRQAVLQAAKLPQVEGRRIGLLGFSLGAFLALAVATQSDLPIAAVADLFGGLPKELREKAKNLPPTLIIHGTADKTVDVQEALELEKLLQKHKRTYEIKIYPGQDHLFKANRCGPDVQDAQRHTLIFFGKHLKSPPIARRP